MHVVYASMAHTIKASAADGDLLLVMDLVSVPNSNHEAVHNVNAKALYCTPSPSDLTPGGPVPTYRQ